MAEQAFEVYRLNLLKRCWSGGLVLYLRNMQQDRDVLRSLDELYSKKLMSKSLAALCSYQEAR